ncbi:uncharacterized protein LOC123316815 [Coccinella septempunctata]|uniref:uncharacterized protein LOC123316815 n=1 Tax=Coccinella septempunctata TaxID=41139 RepID=UPI001D06B3B6|nr:uncharacterized protein LOC123316815 [Coccinella septempunctata]
MELNDRKNAGMKAQEYKLDAPEKRTFWEGVKRLFKEYCEVSSIQGLSYVAKDGISMFERAWWILILILCLGGCSFMIYQLIDKWISTPILVTLATKESTIHNVPFPSVTLCPETKISSRCLNYTDILRKRNAGRLLDVDLQENVYFDHMSLLCKPENHMMSTKALAKQIFQEIGYDPDVFKDVKTEDLVKMDDYAEFLDECKSVTLDYAYCEWMGKNVNCKQALTPILTDEGLCYSFNMFDVRDIYSDVNKMKYYNESVRNPSWDPDSGYPDGIINDVYPRRAFLNGAKNSLVVVFFTKKSEIYYSCRDFALQGVRVSLHMPARIPRPSQVFFSVGLDRLTTVAVTPSLMTTTPTIKEYDPEDRNCYFGTERKLKYFKLYSQANCDLECWTNYTIQYCGCVHFYMPRDAETEICDMNKRICLQEARVNYPISMLAERLSPLDKKSKKMQPSYCNCLPLCTDLTYNAEISSGKWKYYKQVDDERAKEYHASAVKVFFKSSYFLPLEKSELYGIIDFISNSGGILGLFIGFSLFSFAEVIYFLSIKLIENYRKYGYWAGVKTGEDEKYMKMNECHPNEYCDNTKKKKFSAKNHVFMPKIRDYVREYCEVSTIQGLGYILKSTTLFERIWWIVVFLLCMTGCILMIYEVVYKWITTPVLVALSTQEIPIYDIPFPAVTICPETKISHKFLDYTKVLLAKESGNLSSISPQESHNFDFMMPLCRSANHESKLKEQEDQSLRFHSSLQDAESLDDYAEFLDQCKAIDLSINAYCQWMGNDAECEEILTPILTDEGLCYSFNMFDVRDIYSDANVMKYYRQGHRNPDWHPDKGFRKGKVENAYPRRAFRNGAKNALVVVFFTKKSELYYSCRDFSLQGIRVTLHTPSVIPRPSQLFFSVGLDRLTTVAVNPTFIRTTPTTQGYDAHRRFCYFENERKLKYFKSYSQSSCNMECWTNHTINYCGCTHFYMPRDNETRICDMGKRRCLEEAAASYTITTLTEKLNSNDTSTENYCDCLPLCSDLSYNSEIASGSWHFDDPDEVALDGMREWFSKFHASAIRVYFKKPYFLPMERSELYGLTDFISNVGGVLGLFIGFSLFSVAELIFFMVMKPIENLRKYGHWTGDRSSE